MGLSLNKIHYLRCWGCLSLLNWIGVLTKKIGVLICTMKFPSSMFAPYLSKSTIQSYMECWYYAWTSAPNY